METRNIAHLVPLVIFALSLIKNHSFVLKADILAKVNLNVLIVKMDSLVFK